MNIQTFIERKPTPTVKVTSFRQYDGIANAKTEIPVASSAIVFDGGSVTSTEHLDANDIEVLEGTPEEVYMAQCERAITHALNQKFAPHVSTEVDGLNVIVTITNLTETSKKLFGGDVFTTEINCDPENEEKRDVKDGYYAKKSMAYWIAVQLNAAIKVENPETGKIVTLRTSNAKAKTSKAKTTEADDISL